MKWIIICITFILWRISKIGDKPKRGGYSLERTHLNHFGFQKIKKTDQTDIITSATG